MKFSSHSRQPHSYQTVHYSIHQSSAVTDRHSRHRQSNKEIEKESPVHRLDHFLPLSHELFCPFE